MKTPKHINNFIRIQDKCYVFMSEPELNAVSESWSTVIVNITHRCSQCRWMWKADYADTLIYVYEKNHLYKCFLSITRPNVSGRVLKLYPDNKGDYADVGHSLTEEFAVYLDLPALIYFICHVWFRQSRWGNNCNNLPHEISEQDFAVRETYKKDFSLLLKGLWP